MCYNLKKDIEVFSIHNERMRQMKGKIAAVSVLLAVMAALPAVLVGIGSKDNEAVSYTVGTQDSASADKRQAVCAEAASLCESSFCDEAIRAVLAIAECNFSVGSLSSDSNNSDKELYNRVCSIYDSSKEIKLTFDGKPRPVPCLLCSNGQTFSDEKYPYLFPVASPWDCFSAGYDPDSRCVGVSLNGLNELCRQGMTARQALKWYLPGCETD